MVFQYLSLPPPLPPIKNCRWSSNTKKGIFKGKYTICSGFFVCLIKFLIWAFNLSLQMLIYAGEFEIKGLISLHNQSLPLTIFHLQLIKAKCYPSHGSKSLKAISMILSLPSICMLILSCFIFLATLVATNFTPVNKSVIVSN